MTAGERSVLPVTPSSPTTDAQPQSLLSTFLLVDDAQRAGIPDEQMPVAEHAEGASVHVGEVEEIVEVVGAHGAEDGEELEGQVGRHLGGCPEEVAQGLGAGADHQPPAGAQVPREGPPLHVREDLPGEGKVASTPGPAHCTLCHEPISLPDGFERILWTSQAAVLGLCFGFWSQPTTDPHHSEPQQPREALLCPTFLPFSFLWVIKQEESDISRSVP